MLAVSLPFRFSVPLAMVICPEPLMGTLQGLLPVPPLLSRVPVLLNITAVASPATLTSLVMFHDPWLLITLCWLTWKPKLGPVVFWFTVPWLFRVPAVRKISPL